MKYHGFVISLARRVLIVSLTERGALRLLLTKGVTYGTNRYVFNVDGKSYAYL